MKQIERLLDKVHDMAFVAGGAARQDIMGHEAPPAEDIDLFLFDYRCLEACIAALTAMGYHSRQDCYRSILLRPQTTGELDVQLIRPFSDDWSLTYGTPEAVLSKFSFTTEQFAIWGHPQQQTYVGPHAVQHTRERELVVNNVTDPLIVTLRLAKYAQKGYGITTQEAYKLFDAWERRPPGYKNLIRKAQAA